MTRIRKKRSLKRIHSIKTGSISKIKKAQAHSGQVEPKRKLSKEHKQLSAYEKYLLENPEAKKSDQKPIAAKKQEKKAETEVANKKSVTSERPEKVEKKKTLFEQLDETKLKDIY